MIINKDLSINRNIKITANGLSDSETINIIEIFKEIFIEDYIKISSDKKNSDEILASLIKKSVRASLKNLSSKKPEVNAHIIRL